MSDYSRNRGHNYERPQGRSGHRDFSNRASPSVTTPTPCDVTVNLYKYTGKKVLLHAYTVTLVPEVHRNNTFAKFMQIAQANDFKVPFAYDGTSCLVSNQKFQDIELRIPLRDDEQIARIEYKNSYDMNDPHVDQSMMVQCLENISRFHQRQNYYVEKKKMINAQTKPYDLGLGLEILPGLVSSFKITKTGYYVNLDMVYTVFYSSMKLLDLISVMQNSNSRRGGYAGNSGFPAAGSSFYNDFEKFIKNLRLRTIHRERNSTFKAAGIHNESASTVEFEVDGQKQTVAEYFAKTYMALAYPDLPLIVIKKKDMTIYMPLEVLEVPSMQKYPKKLDESMTSSMIKVAAQRPDVRFKLIADKAKEVSVLGNETLKEFGLAFDNSMMNCKGILLPAPKISFGSSSMVSVNNGSWNLRDVKAVSGTVIDEWKIFIFSENDRVSSSNLDNFKRLADNYGIRFTAAPIHQTVRSINDFYNAKKARFNLVILPNKNSQRYEEVKRIADTYAGVYTQCMVSSNLQKLSNPSFVSNLLLKINTKLGGKNWMLDKKLLDDKTTLLVGIDVNHPGVGDLDSPSIVSVVGSIDYDFVTYKTVIAQQTRRQEIVEGLKGAIKTIMRAHFQSTKSKPQRIIVFRDGVGDSMFDAVFNTEVSSIREACSELEAGYQPELNFIVAQKRHSIRFSSNNTNLVPGTVVDDLCAPVSGNTSNSVVSMNNAIYDFYIVSHNALQGTARPVRYIMFLNESNFSNTVLHSTIYHLCHLYMRATKSVSVVPPIYYAHLGAARGKCYLEKNAEGVMYMRLCSSNIDKTLYYL